MSDDDATRCDLDLGALIDRVPEMVVVMGGDLSITFVNQRVLDVMGYDEDALIGTSILDYVHPDDHDYLVSTWANRAAKPGEMGIVIEARGRNADGTWRVVEVLGVSLLEDGVINGMVMTLRDLAFRTGLGDTPARGRSMLDRTTDVLLLVDEDGRIGYANRRVTSRFGVDQDEVVGTQLTGLLPASEHSHFSEWFAELVNAEDGADAQIRLAVDVAHAGSSVRRIVEWHGTNQLDDPVIAGVILSGRDVTELVEMERRLEAQTRLLRHNAEHDALTGLLNRRAFVEELSARLRLRRSTGDRGDAVVLFCDLDGFKAVNDSHGHALGDHVLRVVAERARRCLGDGDVMARWGGDEFTVLLHGSPPDSAVDDLIKRLSERLSTPIAVGGIETEVGVTAGPCRAAVAHADADEMLRRADEAMYARKARQRSARQRHPGMGAGGGRAAG